MNHNFDIFVKEHLQEIFYEAEKDHALAFMRKARINSHNQAQLKLPHQLPVPEIPLQDCAVSPSFSQSHL
jgi:hypothetical protein